MSPLLFGLAALGGGVGAVLRFVLDGVITQRSHSDFPWGILVVNISGSLALGFLTGLSPALLHADWLFVLGSGLLGGYTTFSTAMIDAVRQLQRREFTRAGWNGIGMLLLSTVAALAGLALGGLLAA